MLEYVRCNVCTSYFQTLLNKSDFCFLTEHWLNETNIIFLENFANEFEVVYSISSNCNNTVKGSGGTAILVRKSLGCRIVNLQLNNDPTCIYMWFETLLRRISRNVFKLYTVTFN